MNKFLILSSLIFLFSCTNEEKIRQVKFNDYIENITESKFADGNYLIISNSSCKTCVAKMYDILKEEKTLIILTGCIKVDSVKITNDFENFTVLFDKKNLFFNKKYEEISTYEPIYLKVEKNQIKHILSFDILTRDESFFTLGEIVDGYK